LAPSPPLENERNTNEEGVQPSSLCGFDRNTNGEIREPLRHSKIKEMPTRRELNPPHHVDMTKTQMRRVGTLPATRE
jgi:hypothetical protein